MLRLLSCGYNFIHRDGIYIDRPEGAGNYAFVFFRTNAEVTLWDRAMTVEKNSYMMFSPHTPHSYRSSDLFVNDWLHCKGDDFDSFLARIQFLLDTPVISAHPPSISRSLMELQSVHRLGGSLREEIIDLDLRSLFVKLSDWQQRVPIPRKADQYYRQFIDIRNELYSSSPDHKSVDSIAKSVNLSKSYFQHIYKELFGCPVTSDMINGRLEYAKYLLTNSSSSVQAISKMCGYENETHFMRQFKKFIGETPSRFRQKR